LLSPTQIIKARLLAKVDKKKKKKASATVSKASSKENRKPRLDEEGAFH
jgi:hypothetical protein